MSRLLGLLLLGLLTGLLLLSASSCETSRTRENADPLGQTTATDRHADAGAAHQIMQVSETGAVSFKMSQPVLAAALARQFHDGTAIDRVLARPALATDPKARPVYYLLGLGSRNGSFRAVAMPLRGSENGSFYLTPTANRYVLSSSNCPTCYFDFENGFIVGTTCDDNAGGSQCTLQVLPGNEVFTANTPEK